MSLKERSRALRHLTMFYWNNHLASSRMGLHQINDSCTGFLKVFGTEERQCGKVAHGSPGSCWHVHAKKLRRLED